jgi:enoyl-CoA hydratase/carnithine racemase
MYFYCVSHYKCLNPNQVNALKREFMAELQRQVMRSDDDPASASQVLIRAWSQTR